MLEVYSERFLREDAADMAFSFDGLTHDFELDIGWHGNIDHFHTLIVEQLLIGIVNRGDVMSLGHLGSSRRRPSATSADSLVTIIDDILEYAQVESGRLTIDSSSQGKTRNSRTAPADPTVPGAIGA